jgi:hypothetical protein
MTCPQEIAAIVTEILRTGLLQIRIAGWSGDSNLAAQLADHLHNLPNLLQDFSEEKLTFYWDVERPSFRDSVDDSLVKPYTDLWAQLEPHVHSDWASIVNQT